MLVPARGVAASAVVASDCHLLTGIEMWRLEVFRASGVSMIHSQAASAASFVFKLRSSRYHIDYANVPQKTP